MEEVVTICVLFCVFVFWFAVIINHSIKKLHKLDTEYKERCAQQLLRFNDYL